MESEEPNDDPNLNKSDENYNIIHKMTSKKIKYFSYYMKIYEDLNKMFINFDKTIKLKVILKEHKNDNNEKITFITNKIINIYSNITIIFQNSIQEIINNLTKYINDLKQIETKYSSFSEINKLVSQKTKKILDLKNNYHHNGEELEKLTISCIKKNDLSSIELNNSLAKTKEIFNKYKNEVNDINKYNQDYNKKLKDLIEIHYVPDKVFFYDIIKDELNKNFQTILNIISKSILDLNTIKITPKKISDDKSISNKMKPLEKEEIISFPSQINFNECFDKKDFLIYVKAIKYIKEGIEDENLYKDFDEEKEKSKIKIKKAMILYFDKNKEITDEKSKELINLINDPSNHHILILIMSKKRNVAQRSKKFVDLMGECLNIILNKSIKNNNFEMIKNCIILSQTFYYIDENDNEKQFIFKLIEKNEFFRDEEFWTNFIDNNLLEQFKIYQKYNNLKNVDLTTGKGIDMTNKNNKYSDFMLTQMLPFINNMLDFNMDKNIIIKIVEYFKDKYNYFSENDLGIIMSLIENRK